MGFKFPRRTSSEAPIGGRPSTPSYLKPGSITLSASPLKSGSVSEEAPRKSRYEQLFKDLEECQERAKASSSGLSSSSAENLGKLKKSTTLSAAAPAFVPSGMPTLAAKHKIGGLKNAARSKLATGSKILTGPKLATEPKILTGPKLPTWPKLLTEPNIPTGPRDPNRPRNPFAVLDAVPTALSRPPHPHVQVLMQRWFGDDNHNRVQDGNAVGSQLEGHSGDGIGYGHPGASAPQVQYSVPPYTHTDRVVSSGLTIMYSHPVSQAVDPRQSSTQAPANPSLPPKVVSNRIKSTEFSTVRRDKTMKDLIIYAAGVVRNAILNSKVTYSGGRVFENIVRIYDHNPSTYNLINELYVLSEEGQMEFLSKNHVEIRVDIPADYENPAKSVDVDEQNGYIDHDYGYTPPAERTVIDTIYSLDPALFAYTKNLTITLVFPRNPANTPLNTPIYLVPADGAPVHGATWRLLEKLVLCVDDFTSLKNLTILLHVPSNTRMPLTLPQLYHVLPFYDLEFKNWDLKYQPDNLTMNLTVEGWSMDQLDRERDRVVRDRNKAAAEDHVLLREEQRKYEEAVREFEEQQRKRIEKQKEAKRKRAEQQRKVNEAVFVQAGSLLPPIDLKKLKKGQRATEHGSVAMKKAAAHGAAKAKKEKGGK